MNEHDSERIAGLFEQDGMVRATDEDTADVLFVNTCTIRENADEKLYGTLGQLKQWKLKKENRKLETRNWKQDYTEYTYYTFCVPGTEFRELHFLLVVP